jgi:sugar phosphate permease
VRGIQTWALVLLVVAGTINYIDRSTLSIGGALIRQDLGLGVADMGLLLSAFLWAYAFAQLPGGALIDRFGSRRLLAAGLFLWSLAQASAGFVGSFAQFIVARVVLGLGEAPMFSCGARVVKDWYSVRSRGLPTGVYNCASTLGPTIAPPILTALMLSFGWRWMFIIVGGLGIVVSIIWYVVYRDPGDVALTPDEAEYLASGEESRKAAPISFAEWRHLFTFRMTWGLILGFFGMIYLIWLFQAWLPGYLEIQRHMSIQKTGWVAAVPYAFGVVGSISTGWVADLLVARGFSAIGSRRLPVIVTLLGMSVFTYLTAIAPDTVTAVGCICVVMFCSGAASAMAWALVGVCAPENNTGSIGGIMNFGGYLGGALAPTVTGFIVQETGSFTPALIVGAVVGLASALAYLIVMPSQPIRADDVTKTPGALRHGSPV